MKSGWCRGDNITCSVVDVGVKVSLVLWLL